MWLAASIALVFGLLACGVACIRTSAPSALAALNVAAVAAVLLLMTLTVTFKRQPFMDLAVVLAPMALAGGLAFVRFLERRR